MAKEYPTTQQNDNPTPPPPTDAYSAVKPRIFTPPFRKLRGYAFDPSLSRTIDTAFLNEITYKVRWEELSQPGPVGEYLEVMDYDPSLQKWYGPVDLNNPYLLAQDGLPPSESNPKFHQQMVYAVAMTTIANFESALGRPVLWCPRRLGGQQMAPDGKREQAERSSVRYEEYVPRLRIYPHAFRGANAYYSPQKKALLFGYFSAQPAKNTLQMPDSLVFTCLSHDVVAHETTHAILDGVYRHYIEGTNPDMLAFHEAFADIVALFQHFTFPEVLVHQIAQTRGDLASENLLGQLAQEFGSAVGGYGALRDALGSKDADGKWHPKVPNGDEYQTVTEPHERGSILVAAVFDAFVNIYKNRTADLLRIASGGTGVLPQGQLHPDLVNRLAADASKAARHLLSMCIRALDYCPPTDLTFGDYLRGMITADVDLMLEDTRSYRLALIDAFRKRGIYPAGIRNLSVESLCHATPRVDNQQEQLLVKVTEFLKEFRAAVLYTTNRREIFETTKKYIAGQYEAGKPKIVGLHRRIYEDFKGSEAFEKLTGLVFSEDCDKMGVRQSRPYYDSPDKGPSINLQSLRVASRVGPNGARSNQIIVSLMQRAGVRVINQDGQLHMEPVVLEDRNQFPDPDVLILRGGVNLIFDLDTVELKYAIGKPLLDLAALAKGQRMLDRQRVLDLYHHTHRSQLEAGRLSAYFQSDRSRLVLEPFAFLHEG